MKFNFFKTVRFQFTASLILVFILFVSSIFFTLYLINFRKHDYEILNLSGQLRLMSEEFIALSDNYLITPISHKNESARLFVKSIEDKVNYYNKIIISLKNRKLMPEITGYDEPIICTWDGQSISKLDLMANYWFDFHKNLNTILKNNTIQEIKAEQTAKYINQNGSILVKGSQNLSKGFQYMMESKLKNVKNFNYISIISLSLIISILLFLLVKKVLDPIKKTVIGFKKVENGALGHIVEMNTSNEIGQMANSFNTLSKRMKSISNLIDNINNLNNLEETIVIIYNEFNKFINLDIAYLYIVSPDSKNLQLELFHTDKLDKLTKVQEFSISNVFLNRIFNNQNIIFSNDLNEFKDINKECNLLNNLLINKINSAIFIPVCKKEINEKALLIFGSIEKNAYPPFDIALIQNIFPQIIHSLEKSFLFENLIITTISGLAKLAESRDPETGQHLIRMSLYSMLIAKKMSETKTEINFKYIRDIFKFAPMHDIGKVGVSDSVLLKPGKLNDEEWEKMKKHPIVGGDVLKKCEEQVNKIDKFIFEIGIEISKYHHEKWNGEGYPYGLKGNEIPLSARIVAVADVFDALTSKRPYKDPWPLEKAIEEIKSLSGTHFDPFVIETFINALPEITKIYEKYKLLR